MLLREEVENLRLAMPQPAREILRDYWTPRTKK
jgi:hypothetical protein